MTTKTLTLRKRRQDKHLFLALALSLLSLSALINWGYNALNEPLRDRAQEKTGRLLPKPEPKKAPPRIDLAGRPKPPPLPETAQFSSEGGFFLSDIYTPQYVTESSWTLQAQSSRSPVTVQAQGRKETFPDGTIRFKLRKLKEGRQSHDFVVMDSRNTKLLGRVSFIVDTKAPKLVVYGLKDQCLTIKLGQSVMGIVKDPHLKRLDINLKEWIWHDGGFFHYTPDRVGKQVLLIHATDYARNFSEIKVILEVEESEEAELDENTRELLKSPLAANWTENRRKWKYYGASTCGGAACHAASEPQKKRPGNEYRIWSRKDRHSKAFNTLFSEEASEMCEELNIEDPSKDKSCTSCHSNDVPKDLQGDKYDREDGVSCDACHGPAEGWFKAHTKPHKYEDMLQLGMRNLRDARERAETCLRCHSNINSEFVDAGHPDLSFELFTATQRQPVHYYERNTWDPVRLWSVGLLMGAAQDARAILKEMSKKKPDEDWVSLRAYQYESRVPFLKLLPSGLRNAQSGPFKKIKLLLEDEKISESELKELNKLSSEFDRWAKKLSDTRPRNRYFERTRLKIMAEKILGKEYEEKYGDEFRAEQTAGALWALYNSYYFGEKARMKAPPVTPDPFARLFVRPTVYKPDDLFDDEGSFLSKKWNKRLGRLKSLFGEAPTRRPR